MDDPAQNVQTQHCDGPVYRFIGKRNQEEDIQDETAVEDEDDIQDAYAGTFKSPKIRGIAHKLGTQNTQSFKAFVNHSRESSF